MRRWLVGAVLMLLAGCGPAPAPAEPESVTVELTPTPVLSVTDGEVVYRLTERVDGCLDVDITAPEGDLRESGCGWMDHPWAWQTPSCLVFELVVPARWVAEDPISPPCDREVDRVATFGRVPDGGAACLPDRTTPGAVQLLHPGAGTAFLELAPGVHHVYDEVVFHLADGRVWGDGPHDGAVVVDCVQAGGWPPHAPARDYPFVVLLDDTLAARKDVLVEVTNEHGMRHGFAASAGGPLFGGLYADTGTVSVSAWLDGRPDGAAHHGPFELPTAVRSALADDACCRQAPVLQLYLGAGLLEGEPSAVRLVAAPDAVHPIRVGFDAHGREIQHESSSTRTKLSPA